MSTDLRWLPARVEVYSAPARCKFLTAESFLSLALQSYLGASKALVPPTSQKWVDEGLTFASAEDFYDGLLFEVTERLRVAALASGDLFERFYQASEVDDLDPSACLSAGDIEALMRMAQGCAAVSSAVGPAAEADQSRADARPADPLFVALERQDLPANQSVVHSSANRGALS